MSDIPEEDVSDSSTTPATSGLAVAALICGVVGLCLPPLGLVAIVLGVVALSKIGSSRGRLGGRGLAIAGLITGVVGLVLIFVMAGLLLPVLSRARDQARRAASGNNLGNMIKCCHLYSDASPNLGLFPDDPSKLYPGYVKDPRVFKNPRFPDQNAGYMYIPGLSPVDSTCVVFYENVPANRAKEGRNVVIAAGSVEWQDDSSFQRSLEQTRRVLMAQGIQMQPVPVSVPGGQGPPR